MSAVLAPSRTAVLRRDLDRTFPLIGSAAGSWLFDADGGAYLDAVGGGSMAASLGHGRPEPIAAAARQAREVAYLSNHHFTSHAQEELAARLVALAPPGFTHALMVSGGAEGNEAAVRLARSCHVERGEPSRWQVVSPAQAYHGATMATLGLTGRRELVGPYAPYVPRHLHVPPATWREDPSGAAALAALDRALEAASPGGVSLFLCEPVSAASLPAYTPPEAFWQGLEERRQAHGFLVCFDEVVTGIGRTGTWLNAEQRPLTPDLIVVSKGLGAGYAALGAVLCHERVVEPIAQGSRRFALGHTWDGAPLPCAVGLAVLDVIEREGLLARVRERGAALLAALREALRDAKLVAEVRGHGFLLGIDYCDPRDGRSFPPAALEVARRIDAAALERGLVLFSTCPAADGFAGDQTVIAPAFTTSDADLELLVARVADTVAAVERDVVAQLGGRAEGDDA